MKKKYYVETTTGGGREVILRRMHTKEGAIALCKELSLLLDSNVIIKANVFRSTKDITLFETKGVADEYS